MCLWKTSLFSQANVAETIKMHEMLILTASLSPSYIIDTYRLSVINIKPNVDFQQNSFSYKISINNKAIQKLTPTLSVFQKDFRILSDSVKVESKNLRKIRKIKVSKILTGCPWPFWDVEVLGVSCTVRVWGCCVVVTTWAVAWGIPAAPSGCAFCLWISSRGTISIKKSN